MEDDKRKPGRPKKVETQRRRKSGEHGRGRLKLTAPEIKGYYTRWMSDKGNRLHDATHSDDYDFVTKAELQGAGIGESGDNNNDLGSRVRVLVGTHEDKPLYQYLMKKSLKFHKDDLAENERNRRESEEVLRRGSDKIENQYGSIKNV